MLGAAAVLLVGLGILGAHVESRLRPTTLSVPGTPSAQGAALLKSHFGDSAPFAVLLRGPAAAIDRQGPRLVRALRAQAKTSTLSPWDGASLSQLRPGPGRALVLVDFHRNACTRTSRSLIGAFQSASPCGSSLRASRPVHVASESSFTRLRGVSMTRERQRGLQ